MSQNDHTQEDSIRAYFISMNKESEINNYEYLLYMHEAGKDGKDTVQKQDSEII